MATNNDWASAPEVYSPSQVEAVLKALGIEIGEYAGNDFLSYCPFHSNRDTPAFFTSGNEGTSACLNPSCTASNGLEGFRLTLDRLVMRINKVSSLEAKRFILLQKNVGSSFQDRFDSISVDKIELKEFPPQAIATMHERLKHTPAAVYYLQGRGFLKKTLTEFNVGFTPKTEYGAEVYRPFDMVVVPAYDHRSKPVGLIGRSIEGKHFKNYGPEEGGRGFHKSQIVWNLNNARKHETIILTESTFDAMRVHQAGYPNVGALLGGNLSKVQEELIRRHFGKVIIMTDNETGNDMSYPVNCKICLRAGFSYCQGHQPGRDLGMKIADRLSNLRISWAVYDDRNIYANNVKDAAGMTDDEIVKSLRGAISHFDYLEMVA